MINLKWLSAWLLVISSVINLSIQRSGPLQDEKELVPLLQELTKAYERQESERSHYQSNQLLYGTNIGKNDKQREKYSPAISTKQKIKEKRLNIPQQYNLREEYEKYIKSSERINNKYRHLQDLIADLTKRVMRCGCSGNNLQLRCGCSSRQDAEKDETALENGLSRAIQEVLNNDEKIRYELRCRCQGRSQSLRCGCKNINRSNDKRSRTSNGNALEDLRCGCKGIHGTIRCGCSRNRDDAQLRAMLAIDEDKEDLLPMEAVATNVGELKCGCGGRSGYLKCGCSRGRDNEEHVVDAVALEEELVRAITDAYDDTVPSDLRCGCQGWGKVLRCGCGKGRVRAGVEKNELRCNCKGKNGQLRCECSGKAFDVEDDLAKLLTKVRVDDIDLVHVKNDKEITVCQSGQCYEQTLLDTDDSLDGRRDLVDHDKGGTQAKGDGMAFNDFLNYFVHMDRNVLRVVRDYIYSKTDVNPPSLPKFVDATQRKAIESLRNSIKKLKGKGINQHLIQKRLEQVFFGNNVISSVRPHSLRDQHAVYIPRDLYEQIDKTKDDTILRSSKNRFPLTKKQLDRKIKQKMRNGTVKSQVFWRRHVLNDHMAYGFPFEMEVEGLGQINV